MTSQAPVRVLFSCSGIGIFNRGIESFFREAFDGLAHAEGLEARLLKGAGPVSAMERVVHCLPRTSTLANTLGKLIRRSSYTVEQWTSFPSVVAQIREFRPQVVFYSDGNLGFLLRRFRRQIGVPFRLLFSNGGPCHPPFDRHDFVQQVAPFYLDEALAAGEPAARHFMVPYGILPPAAALPSAEEKRAARVRLGLPVDRPVVLSVGWIARQHKRMDYVIEELSRLPEPRPFLQMLGAMDEHSAKIVQLAEARVGRGNFSAASVPYSAVADYYRAADVFVLGSLKEGFGRVYLESLLHGLPTIAHHHPVMQFVLGQTGRCADLSTPGTLAAVLADELAKPFDAQLAARRRSEVLDRFGWAQLQSAYVEMFRAAATDPMP